MAEFLAWKADPSRYFGIPDPTFEKLRKPWPEDAPYQLVETSYFGFNIPEEKINCEVYHWVHPKFGVASGGIMIFRGNNLHQKNAELIEYCNFQPLPEDITDCTYADGVKIKMIKPMEEFEVSFSDPANKTSVHFVSRAIMPPAFRPTGGHITQAFKTTGSLVLRGKSYQIDGHFTRDRSWGDPRSEMRLNIPPIGWYVAVFGDDLAFHITAFETPELNPGLAKQFPGLENGKNHIWGYVWKSGKLLGVKSCRSVVQREADNVTPKGSCLTIVDENGDSYTLTGVIEARLPMCIWPSMTFYFAMTRWTLSDETRVGWGDTQEGQYESYIRENCLIAETVV